MKKSYNPFKMFGSYLGLLILLSFGSFIWPNNPLSILLGEKIAFYIWTNQQFLISFLLHLILGFLLGWGIHSLFRTLRK